MPAMIIIILLQGIVESTSHIPTPQKMTIYHCQGRQTPTKINMTINGDNHSKVQKLKNNICNFRLGSSESFQLGNNVIKKILFLFCLYHSYLHILHTIIMLRNRYISILVQYLHNLLMQKLPVLIRCQQNCMIAPCHSNFSLSSRAFLTER